MPPRKEEDTNTYTKIMSNFIFNFVHELNKEDIVFQEIEFEKLEKEVNLDVEELETLLIYDPNRFKKK